MPLLRGAPFTLVVVLFIIFHHCHTCVHAAVVINIVTDTVFDTRTVVDDATLNPIDIQFGQELCDNRAAYCCRDTSLLVSGAWATTKAPAIGPNTAASASAAAVLPVDVSVFDLVACLMQFGGGGGGSAEAQRQCGVRDVGDANDSGTGGGSSTAAAVGGITVTYPSSTAELAAVTTTVRHINIVVPAACTTDAGTCSCVAAPTPTTPVPPVATTPTAPATPVTPPTATSEPVNCQATLSDWAPCSVTCGPGTRTRTYTELVAAQNGGLPCTAMIEAPRTWPCNDSVCPTNDDGTTTINDSDDVEEETPSEEPVRRATMLDGDFIVDWQMRSGATPSIVMTMRQRGSGWLGIGFPLSTPGMMANSDAVLGWVDDDGSVHVADYDIGAQRMVGPLGVHADIGTNDVTLVDGGYDGEWTWITFERPLRTQDPVDKVLTFDADFDVNVARDTKVKQLGYHGFEHRGSGTIRTQLAVSTSSTSLNTGDSDVVGVITPTSPPPRDISDVPDTNVVAAVPDPQTPVSTAGGISNVIIVGKIQVQVTIDRPNNKLSFIVEGRTNGYVGFGFSPNGGMIGSRVVAGWLDFGGTPHLNEYNLSAKDVSGILLVPDPVLSDVSASAIDGNLILRWTRPIRAPDGHEILLDTDINCIWSIGSTKGLAIHQSMGRGRINLSKGEYTSVTPFDWRVVHGALMSIGMGVLLPFGVFFPAFMKKEGTNLFFQLHRGMQMAGALFVFAGLGTAIVSVNESEGKHFDDSSFHPRHGMAIVTLIFLQVCSGYFRIHKGHAYRQTWLRAHRFVGRCVILMGFLQILVGLQYYEELSQTDTSLSFMFAAIWIGIMLMLGP